MAKPLQIISWNVNGIRAMLNKGFYETIRNLDPDILCVQETKAPDNVVTAIAAQLTGYTHFANSAVKKGYSGTAVFTRIKPVGHSYNIGINEHDQEGRVIAVEFDIFYLVNVYVPNSGQVLDRLGYRSTWDKALLAFIKKLDAAKPDVFTGDLNVAHEAIDLARPKQNYNKSAGYTQIEIDGIKAFIAAGLVDTYRHFNKDRVQYTFWNQRFNARATNVGWRIDYFLVSERLMPKVKSGFILDEIMGSDHCPVGITIEA